MRAISMIQRGFSLISAIFLLVVVAALGTFAVTLSTTQHQSTALDVMGARAYQAARAGIEWGAFQLLQNAAGAYTAACRAGATSQGVAPLPNTLNGFTVNVGCSATAHDEGTRTIAGGNPIWVYQLTSAATQGAAAEPNYIERVITVTIAQ